MPRAVLPVRVARNDGEWTVYRQGDHLLSVCVTHDWSADPAISLKALAIQPLARSRPFQLGQPLTGSGSITVLYGGGLNLSHSGRIRIRLRCHIPSVRSRIADHLEHHRRFAKTGTVDVNHMQWSIGFARER